MRTIVLSMPFLLCLPMSAQLGTVPYGDEGHRCEVYALAGYQNTWETAYPGFYSPGPHPRARHWGGGQFGAGIGVRAVSIAGVQAEFFQVRNAGRRLRLRKCRRGGERYQDCRSKQCRRFHICCLSKLVGGREDRDGAARGRQFQLQRA